MVGAGCLMVIFIYSSKHSVWQIPNKPNLFIRLVPKDIFGDGEDNMFLEVRGESCALDDIRGK